MADTPKQDWHRHEYEKLIARWQAIVDSGYATDSEKETARQQIEDINRLHLQPEHKE